MDENGTYYKEFPIARYECHGKGKRKISHTTFSLLPYQLIPYRRYSIPFVIKILEVLSMDTSVIDDVLDYAANLGRDDILSISAVTVSAFKKLGLEVIEKMIGSGYYINDINNDFNSFNIKQRVRVFIRYAEGFCCTKTDNPIRGPCGLAYDFYLRGGSYYNNAPFLFGTPSQFAG